MGFALRSTANKQQNKNAKITLLHYSSFESEIHYITLICDFTEGLDRPVQNLDTGTKMPDFTQKKAHDTHTKTVPIINTEESKLLPAPLRTSLFFKVQVTLRSKLTSAVSGHP